jgi:tetratricopeptide (TPR) repeat protein
VGWALALLCASPSGVRAAAGVASCDDDAACRPVVSRAREFSKAGQLDDALLSYQAAYRITPDPRILFNIARIQHKQNKLTDALESYQKFIDAKFDDENLRSKAQEYMTQIQAARAAEPPPAAMVLTSSTEKPPADSGAASRPVYKKAWFWVLIGGLAAAGIAGGVAGGVIASQQPPSAPESVPTFHLFK